MDILERLLIRIALYSTGLIDCDLCDCSNSAETDKVFEFKWCRSYCNQISNSKVSYCGH